MTYKSFFFLIISGLIIFSGFFIYANSNQKSFKSTSDASFLEWITMRIKEGSYPLVTKKEIDSIIGNVDIALINSPSIFPQATWLGHATVLVQYRGINFLTDPHLTDRPAPIDYIVPKRLTPPALSFDKIPKIDFIIISHNHYDHLDSKTVNMYKNSVIWYIPLGLKNWFLEQGINSSNIIELNWWESHQFNKDVRITFTPSVHWSKRTPLDTNKSLWGSWSVKIGEFNSWFGGDTAYDEKMFKEIAERTGPYDLSFIPIGAYSPKYFMLKQHVDPAQAILIHKNIKSKNSIAIHWGTFQLTHEPFLEPPKLLKQLLKKEKKLVNQFKVIKIGETFKVLNIKK